jgi:TonB family protein
MLLKKIRRSVASQLVCTGILMFIVLNVNKVNAGVFAAMKVDIQCSGKDIPNPTDSILSINANQPDSMGVVFTVVEEMPDFPGGDKARIQFLVENIKYPREAREHGIQGIVYITFIITITGEIKDVRSLKSPHQLLTNEAIRVIKLMPKWIPGKQNGKAVNVQYNMPIKFTLTVD